MNGISFKLKVHQHCQSLLSERIESINKTINDIQQSAKGEAKSSMGDKYETGAAVAHLEIEKQQSALYNLSRMQNIFDRIDPKAPKREILPGALLNTNHGWIYVAAGLGKIIVENIEVMVISPQAPITTILTAVLAGNTGALKGEEILIDQIY